MKNITLLLSTLLMTFITQIQIASAGSDHSHEGSSHDGIVASFSEEGGKSGFLELKLHDDKGDLEIWLTEGDKKRPFDLPVNSALKVTFPELDNKTVVLQVRNKVVNEDENGKANIRDDKTNYFIFPGDTGADASFLIGSEFSSKVVVTFTLNETVFSSDTFVLTPHTHWNFSEN